MDTALVITILVLSILAMAKLIRLNRKKETLNSSRRHIARHHAPVHIPDSHSPDVIDVGGGFVLVKGSYLNKFLKGGILDDDLYISMDEYGYNRVSKPKLEKMERALFEYTKRTEALNLAVYLNNKGVEMEKAGRIDDAIDIYKHNILPQSYLTMLPYERLMILYRKKRDYCNERSVIEKAICAFPNEERFLTRLERVSALIDKEKKGTKNQE